MRCGGFSLTLVTTLKSTKHINCARHFRTLAVAPRVYVHLPNPSHSSSLFCFSIRANFRRSFSLASPFIRKNVPSTTNAPAVAAAAPGRFCSSFNTTTITTSSANIATTTANITSLEGMYGSGTKNFCSRPLMNRQEYQTNDSGFRPLWVPPNERVDNSHMVKFMNYVRDHQSAQISINNYTDLHKWSIDDVDRFWNTFWRFANVRPPLDPPDNGANNKSNNENMYIQEEDPVRSSTSSKQPKRVRNMMDYLFFSGQKFNYAENLLRNRSSDGICVIFTDEQKRFQRSLTWKQLYERTTTLAVALNQFINHGDRVCAIACNTPETIICMLAVTSIGGIWCSCSPDFGVECIMDRFGQVQPTVLMSTDFYTYKGKYIQCIDKAYAVAAVMPSIKQLLFMPFNGRQSEHCFAEVVREEGVKVPRFSCVVDDLYNFSARYGKNGEGFEFARTSFNSPLFLLFSSGTTGLPKCIVHRQGLLLQILKEHMLHLDVKPGDRVFYYTSCGWMMWNWLVSALASSATLLLYDGSPIYPSIDSLWEFTTKHNCTLFGTSAKYIETLANAGFSLTNYDGRHLRTITSTGSPLSHESFHFVYSNIKRDVHLVSMSGGTDICSCFALGDPTSPVYSDEIQAKGLGMAVNVFDEYGRSVSQRGELVCTEPFVAQPVGFWGDDKDKSKYRSAYYSKYPGVWAHGDFASLTHRGGIVIHGRSDTVLNPGGVRLGTAEIYRQIERIPEILESVAVGREVANDVQIVLFVRTRDEIDLGEAMKSTIRRTIRAGATPRHVPAEIYKVHDIPRTRTGKIAELAVRNAIHNLPIANLSSLYNPHAITEYRQYANVPKARL